MIHHAEAMPHRRISNPCSFVLPTALSLEELIKARPIFARSTGAVGTHVAIDEIGTDCTQSVVTEAKALGGRHAEVVMHDVGATHEPLQNRTRFRILEVECDPAFASLTAFKDARDGAHHVARRRLDLDDVGAEIREEHRCKGAGEEVSQIEYSKPRQRRSEGFVRFCDRGNILAKTRIAYLTQDRSGISAEARCGTADARGRMGRVGMAWLPNGAQRGVVDGHDVVVRDRLLVEVDFAERNCGLDGNVTRPEILEPDLTVVE